MAEPDQMFAAFARDRTTTERQIEGTGLGLAICQKIIEAHGGAIGAQSELGVGSTLWFEVPCRAVPVPASAPEATAAYVSLTGHVLLVEDNQVNQQVARKHLERLGMNVTIAEDGQQALEAIDRSTFDLILMDSQMPVMNGRVATQAIRERGMTLPILALTADAMAKSRQDCLDAGMNDVLTKPIKRDELATQLARWLPERRTAG